MGRKLSTARERQDRFAGNAQKFRDYGSVNEGFLFPSIHGVFRCPGGIAPASGGKLSICRAPRRAEALAAGMLGQTQVLSICRVIKKSCQAIGRLGDVQDQKRNSLPG